MSRSSFPAAPHRSGATSRRRSEAPPDVRDRRTAELLELAWDCTDELTRQKYFDEVVLINGPVAEAIASRYRDRGVELDDLIQVAYLGLVKAVHGYRIGEGPGFLAYAVPTVTGELKRYFRDFGWMIRPPRRVQELRGAAAATAGSLYQQQGRPPTTQEVADALGVGEAELSEVALADGCYRTLSLDAPALGDRTPPLADVLVEAGDIYEDVVTVESLRPALRDLGERDRRILSLRYVQGWTQERIGREIGVSQMQVSRLLSRILETLRARLTEHPDATSAAPPPSVARSHNQVRRRKIS